jgi:site-specific DNA-cytosine methylase
MNVLSLFDGIGGAWVALQKAGFRVSNYYSCEIDKGAIQVVKRHIPEEVFHPLGDVKNFLNGLKDGSILLPPIDLCIFGSPCQDLSASKKNRTGISGTRSGLFYVASEILQIVKPTFFLMENVASMTIENRDEISRVLGVKCVCIQSHWFTPLTRGRLYWGSHPIDAPTPSIHVLSEILDPSADNDDRLTLTPAALERLNRIEQRSRAKGYGYKSVYLGPSDRMLNLDASYGKGPDGKRGIIRVSEHTSVRMISPLEAERLQGFPDGWTDILSKTARYHALGNSFTVPVIAYCLIQMMGDPKT